MKPLTNSKNILSVSLDEFKPSDPEPEIRYGFHPTPFGLCLLALTQRGCCWLSFPSPDHLKEATQELQSDWKKARLVHDPEATQTIVQRIFSVPKSTGSQERPLPLLLRGTPFQLSVWKALLEVGPGEVTTYEAIALRVGKPSASRAVGNAVGRNAISYLIPCHRVLTKNGQIGGYRWGTTRKAAMLDGESSQKK